MAAASSKKVIFAALAGNGLIAVTKLSASIYTGSSAMLSEAIHSAVDTGNQGLLLFGLKQSAKPADEKHPFGYGSEMYFWAFVVAILIFAVGAGVSIYEGVHKTLHPTAVTDPHINFIVLGLACIFEGFACWIAYKEFKKANPDLPIFSAVRKSKDPALFTVLFEDAAAMLGLIVAAVGLAIGWALDMPIFDGIASIVIGFILGGTAVLLAIETKGLLVGEATHPETEAAMHTYLQGRPEIERVNELRTVHFGAHDVLAAISLDFEDALTAQEIEAAITDMERDIKAAHPSVKRIFIEAQSWLHHLADAEASTPSGSD